MFNINLMPYQLAFVKNIFFGTEVASGGNLIMAVGQIVDFLFAERGQRVEQFVAAAAAAETVFLVLVITSLLEW